MERTEIEAKTKAKGAVRVARLKIVGIEGADFRERTRSWKELATAMQRAINRLWLGWWQWHEDRGHGRLVADWMDALPRAGSDRQSAPWCLKYVSALGCLPEAAEGSLGEVARDRPLAIFNTTCTEE